MIREKSKQRLHSWIPRGGIELSLDPEFEQDDWVEHMSARAARAAAWRRKQRDKRRQRRDSDKATDH